MYPSVRELSPQDVIRVSEKEFGVQQSLLAVSGEPQVMVPPTTGQVRAPCLVSAPSDRARCRPS